MILRDPPGAESPESRLEFGGDRGLIFYGDVVSFFFLEERNFGGFFFVVRFFCL